jgi:hypothetical protein
VFYALTDLFFSLAPLPLIISLNRPVFEKIVISMLMALGIFATITSMVKLRFLSAWDRLTDTTWQTSDFYLWAGVEGCVAIFAASVPQLKSLFHGLIEKSGLFISMSTNWKPAWPKLSMGTLSVAASDHKVMSMNCHASGESRSWKDEYES